MGIIGDPNTGSGSDIGGRGSGGSPGGTAPGTFKIINGNLYQFGTDGQWHLFGGGTPSGGSSGGGGSSSGGGGGFSGGGSSGGGSSGGGGGRAMPPPIVATTGAGIKLDQASYDALTQQYRHGYSLYHGDFNLSKGYINLLIKNDVTPQEFLDRLEAEKRANEYAPYLAALERISGKNLKPGERLGFFLGQAPKAFYDLWEQANAESAATTAGFYGQNPNLQISEKQAKQIVAALPGRQTEADFGQLFTNLAQVALQALPYARGHGLAQVGQKGHPGTDTGWLTTDVLIKAVEGDQQASQYVNQVLANAQAVAAGPNLPRFQQTQSGGRELQLAGLAPTEGR